MSCWSANRPACWELCNGRRWERHLRRKAVAWLQSDKVGREAGRMLDEQLQKLLESDQPLREFVPNDLIEGVQNWIEEELPELMERLLTLLQDPEVRKRLGERAQNAHRWIHQIAGHDGRTGSGISHS